MALLCKMVRSWWKGKHLGDLEDFNAVDPFNVREIWAGWKKIVWAFVKKANFYKTIKVWRWLRNWKTTLLLFYLLLQFFRKWNLNEKEKTIKIAKNYWEEK